MQKHKMIIATVFIFLTLEACLQQEQTNDKKLITGAEQTASYLPMLDGRRVALVANHASLIGGTHLADSLLALKVNLVRIMAPEHGFRGIADAGEHVGDGKDTLTGLPVVSLYGKNRKPPPSALQDVDIILFDLQDVGVRFYTYISTLAYVMEAAAEQDIPLIILDRPNPNGFYVDGPVMEKQHASFVGLHPVPIVYGMTIGEYGMMVNGEGWLPGESECELRVIPLKNYDRRRLYRLPVPPSPNLPGWQAIYLYPSLCLFEGTVVSVGRGTDHPFSIYGHPELHTGSYAFVPESRAGARKPKFEGKQCFGQNLSGYAENYTERDEHLNLVWLLAAYEVLGKDSAFFLPYFEKLAGTNGLREQIMQASPIGDIRASWEDGLERFLETRKKYLIYEDFE
jgi:uncharacterized protein YbbC (DUF1343 family)